MIINKEEQIKEICKLICVTCAQFDGCAINCKAHKNTAEILYKAGYRKVPDGAIILTPKERDEELKACNEKQAELEAEIDRLKGDNEALQIWNDAYTEENEKLKKMNDIAHVFLGQAIRHIDVDEQLDHYMQANKEGAQEFAKKLKSKLNDYHDDGEKGAYLTESDIDEALKEFLK